MAEKDSLSEIGEIPHTEADSLQNLCFVGLYVNSWGREITKVIDVPAAGSYRVTFKAKASMNREIRLALEKDGQSPLMDETMSVSGDWTNYSYDFTVSSAASGVKIVFMLGIVGTTENMAHTISIDDISLYKVS